MQTTVFVCAASVIRELESDVKSDPVLSELFVADGKLKQVKYTQNTRIVKFDVCVFRKEIW